MMIDVDSSDAYYYHQDANGNVICMTNSSQEIVEGYSYDAFGQCTVNTTKGTDGCWLTPDGDTQSYSDIGNPYLFTGRRLDPETGLYYYRFRMYDPYIGRFCQPDPISYAGGMNLYAYVGNNPLNWIDPWGLDKKDNEQERKYRIFIAAHTFTLHQMLIIDDPTEENKPKRYDFGRHPLRFFHEDDGFYRFDYYKGEYVVPGTMFYVTGDQALEALNILTELVGTHDPYSLTTWNCRHFAQTFHEVFHERYGGEITNKPNTPDISLIDDQVFWNPIYR